MTEMRRKAAEPLLNPTVLLACDREHYHPALVAI